MDLLEQSSGERSSEDLNPGIITVHDPARTIAASGVHEVDY